VWPSQEKTRHREVDSSNSGTKRTRNRARCSGTYIDAQLFERRTRYQRNTICLQTFIRLGALARVAPRNRAAFALVRRAHNRYANQCTSIQIPANATVLRHQLRQSASRRFYSPIARMLPSKSSTPGTYSQNARVRGHKANSSGGDNSISDLMASCRTQMLPGDGEARSRYSTWNLRRRLAGPFHGGDQSGRMV